MEPWNLTLNYSALEDEMYALVLKYLKEAWTKNSNVDAYVMRLSLLIHLYSAAGATDVVEWILSSWDVQYNNYKSEGGKARYRPLR